MNKYVKIVLAALLFLSLIAVRALSTKLFYDPLKHYFLNDYLYTTIPSLDAGRLVLHMFFRYCLNTVISLGIIWVLFKRKDYLKFCLYFYTTAFVILILLFVYLLQDNFESGYLLPFYIRRFIIQPLFILILLPAFYYQKRSSK